MLHLSQAGRLDVESPAKRHEAEGRGGAGPVRRRPGDPGARARPRAQGEVVGARRRRRRPARRARARAGLGRVRDVAPHRRRQAPDPHVAARSAHRRRHRSRLRRRRAPPRRRLALRDAGPAHTRGTGPCCSTRSVPRSPRRSSRAVAHRRTVRAPSSATGSGSTTATGCRARNATTGMRRVSFESHEITYCPTCQTGGKILADRRMSRLVK